MGKNIRSHRIAEEIKKVISLMLISDLKDPRISSMVSITQVEVTEDLSFAKVYLSVYGSEEDNENTLLALKSGAGFIRKEVGKKIKMRRVPELIFKIDDSLDYSLHISKLIKQIGKDDNDNHEE